MTRIALITVALSPVALCCCMWALGRLMASAEPGEIDLYTEEPDVWEDA